MRPQFPFSDEVVLLSLSGIEFEGKQVSAEVVERITESRCASSVDCQHIFTLRMSVWEHKCGRLETTVCQEATSV